MAPLPLLRRTVELLTHSWDLSRRLRVPAISRLQKMHNVGLALQALRSRGVQLEDERGERRARLPRPRDGPRPPASGSSTFSPSAGNAILAKDIVDRHREKTLALLWQMALAFQVLRGGCRSRFLSVCPVKTTEITPASWAPLGPGRCGTCSVTVPIAPAPRPASGVSSPPHRAQTRAQGHVGDGKRWEPGLRGPKSRDLDPPMASMSFAFKRRERLSRPWVKNNM